MSGLKELLNDFALDYETCELTIDQWVEVFENSAWLLGLVEAARNDGYEDGYSTGYYMGQEDAKYGAQNGW